MRNGIARRAARTSASNDAQDSFRWFFLAEYPRVTRTAYHVVFDRTAAEDVAQEAFIQLANHWSSVSQYDNPAAWVRRVAIRLAVREATRSRRRASTHLRAVSDAAVAAPTVNDPAERQPDPELVTAIRGLPPQQRAIVVMFYLEDRPMDEIADIVGCSRSTGWVHLHRARSRLAELLGEEDSDDER